MIDPNLIPKVSLTTEGRVEGWEAFIEYMRNNDREYNEILSKLKAFRFPDGKVYASEIPRFYHDANKLCMYSYFCLMQRMLKDLAIYSRNANILVK
jgi:hypothetical protein